MENSFPKKKRKKKKKKEKENQKERARERARERERERERALDVCMSKTYEEEQVTNLSTARSFPVRLVVNRN